jgi:integrase
MAIPLTRSKMFKATTVYLTAYREGNMIKRRTKGEGSVYQRKDGRFIGEYSDAFGKRRYVSGKNKTEVKAKIKTKLKEKEEGIVPANTKFGTYLAQWLESTKGTVGPRTYQRAEETVRLQIKPKLGRARLDTITALQLDTFYRLKAKELSPRSVQIIHVTVHKALKQAARWRMVWDHVAQHATLPRVVQKATDVLTKDQAQILLRTAKKNQPKLYALWALSVSTGARLGELLGLQPEDVCLESGTLRIARSVHNSRVRQPKTRAGARTIVLSRVALDAVREHLDKHAGNTWLFQSPVKEWPIHRSTLQVTYWKPLLRMCGLPLETRIHDLRHTAASLLIADGVPIPVVSQLLSHADSAVTLRIYAHFLKDQLGAAALAMNGLLEESETNS